MWTNEEGARFPPAMVGSGVFAGEFTLEFGDYRVRITVPDDHVVAATGVRMRHLPINPPKLLAAMKAARNG